MAHKTLVNGTAYEIGGGKTLVNGTAYSIDKGKTLVGGTAYEIGFGPSVAVVTLTSSSFSGDYDNATATINGVNYRDGDVGYGTNIVLEVPIGTEITCSAICGAYSGMYYGGKIYKNETIVVDGASTKEMGYYTYTFIVTGDVTIDLQSKRMGYYVKYGEVHITEQ